MSTNKYIRYSTKLKSTREASLLGLLAKALGKKVNFSPSESDLSWIDDDISNNEDIILTFARIDDVVDIFSYRPSSYETVEFDKMLGLLQAPALPTVQLNRDLKAVVLPNGSVVAYGMLLEAKEMLNIGEKLVARGVPEGKGRYLAVPVTTLDETRLAVALAVAGGYYQSGSTPHTSDKFVCLDLIGKEVWPRDSVDEDVYVIVNMNEFIRNAKVQEYYTTEISGGGYTVSVRPDGGVLHVGCQTISAEKGLELYALIKAAVASYVPPVLGNEKPEVHNPDEVDEMELAGGYRFLDADEIVKGNSHRVIVGLEMWEGGGRWDKGHVRGNSDSRTYRTKFTRDQLAALRRGEKVEETVTEEDKKLVEELEAPVAAQAPAVELHNPGNLEGGAYGADEGYRLLNADEVRVPLGKNPTLQEIERRNCSGRWVAGASGDSSGSTYRTRLTPQELAARRGIVTDPSVPAEVPVADPVAF